MKKFYKFTALVLSTFMLISAFPVHTYALTRDEVTNSDWERGVGENDPNYFNDREARADSEHVLSKLRAQDFDGMPDFRYITSDYNGYTEIINVAKNITKNCSTDEQKAKIIHDYICNNFAYDYKIIYDSYINHVSYNKKSVLEGWREKKMVCYGFANLYSFMCRAAGVPCAAITEGDHRWNAAYFNGSWHLIDVTWDCKNKYYGDNDPDTRWNQAPSDKYFYMSKNEFLNSHYAFSIDKTMSDVVGIYPNYRGGDHEVSGDVLYVKKNDRIYYSGEVSLKRVDAFSSVDCIYDNLSIPGLTKINNNTYQATNVGSFPGSITYKDLSYTFTVNVRDLVANKVTDISFNDYGNQFTGQENMCPGEKRYFRVRSQVEGEGGDWDHHVTFISSNPRVAAVTDGSTSNWYYVNAYNPGTTTFTGISDDNSAATFTFTITVDDKYRYRLKSSNDSICTDGRRTRIMLESTAADPNNDFDDIDSKVVYTVINTTTGEKTEYTSECSSGEGVSSAGFDFRPNSAGVYKIYAYGKDSGVKLADEITLNVTEKEKPVVKIKSIHINTDKTLLKPGESTTLSYSVSPRDAQNPGVTWASDRPDLISVDQNGVATAHYSNDNSLDRCEYVNITATVNGTDIKNDRSITWFKPEDNTTKETGETEDPNGPDGSPIDFTLGYTHSDYYNPGSVTLALDRIDNISDSCFHVTYNGSPTNEQKVVTITSSDDSIASGTITGENYFRITPKRAGKTMATLSTVNGLKIEIPVTVVDTYASLYEDVWDQQDQQGQTVTTMLRLYNPNTGEHFYTGNEGEYNSLVQLGWMGEGQAWLSPGTGDSVYRLYNPNNGDHHYTTSAGERDHLTTVGWQYESIAWHTECSGAPVYRLYNPNNTGAGSHHYTKSEGERDQLVAWGWSYEGIAWYGM